MQGCFGGTWWIIDHRGKGEEMIKTDKLIVSVCPVGSWVTKEVNPNVPIQPEEIAEEALRCENEGASIVHIHARDKAGNATTDPQVFREIDNRIREKGCTIIIQHSISPGRSPQTATKSDINYGPENVIFGQEGKGLEAFGGNPEMASMDIGIAVHTGATERVTLWTRNFLDTIARTMLDKGIKPEPEIFNDGGMVEISELIRKGLLAKPYWIGLCFGLQRTSQNRMPYTPKQMMHLVDLLPEEALFTTAGVGPDETPAAVLSILLGGHARVGFEDNPYYSKGVKAKSNAELVTRIVRVGQDIGRKIATPDEARELLGIPPLKKQ
jgi:3-keto-5-aminohexanoate cleavage enzyme